MLPVPAHTRIGTDFGVKCCGTTGRPHYWLGHIHKGVDFPGTTGADVVAVWGGKVISANWGSAFGTHVVIDTDSLPDGSPGLWVGYMHLSRKTVFVGQIIKAGQKIGELGATGNVTGPHLHLEVQKSSTWSSTGYADPDKWLNAQKYTYLQDRKVYQSAMVFGKSDSDSVRNVQMALNEKNNANLPITGNYLDLTKAEVTKWQIAQGWTGSDADGIVGPGTAKTLDLVWVAETVTPPPVLPVSPHVALIKEALADIPNVVYVAGWDNPARAGNGNFTPEYVMMHHTAGTNSLSTLLPGGTYPTVCGANFLINADGKVQVLSAYKSYHAGRGSLPGVPVDQMNDFSWGIEIENLGVAQDMPQIQIGAAAAVAGALIKMNGSTIDKVINHKTWSSTGKPDTLYPDKFWQDRAAGISETPSEWLTKAEADTLYAQIGTVRPMPAMTYKQTPNPTTPQNVGLDYVTVTGCKWTPPRVGVVTSTLYLNCQFELKTGVETASIRVRAVRDAYNGKEASATAYQDFTVTRNGYKPGEFLITHTWMEQVEAGRPIHWEVRRSDEFKSFRIETRHSKWALI